MIKTSVKKPFTVLVAVIMVLVLGVVSLTSMTTDLLPPMSLPYLIVVTTYPGASPEKVEAEVVRPMESALGTISGVSNVYSTSAENYGMVQLEFEDGTDMDSTLVKVNTALQGVSATLPELCSAPSIIELSMDMMATMYVSVSREGYDIFELSKFVTDTIQPYLERQNGVASVSGIGLVEQSIHVSLDQKKIDDLNAKILQTINESLAAAAQQLDAAEQQVKDGKAELEKAQATYGATMAGTLFGQIEEKVTTTAADLKIKVNSLLEQVRTLRKEITDGQTGQLLDSLIAELETVTKLLESESLTVEDLMQAAGSLKVIISNVNDLLKLLDTELENGDSASISEVRQQLADIESSLSDLSATLDSVPQILAGLEDAYATLTQAQLDAAVAFATASTQLAGAEAQLTESRAQYEAAKESALSNANLSQLLSVSTLSQLIYAQNFSMPAGYIDDAKDNTWLLKIGNEYETLEDLSSALLVKMDAIGEVRLSDVATVTILDNADLTYARFNGEQAVILSIFKNSVTGTNETANNCLDAFKELEDKYPGTRMATLMNQGSYIEIIIDSVVSSMVTGAILAIIILALFLKDVKPTLVVAVSIPLSVMFTLVLMYFTGISLNMMTLCGLALGIGMLVDNSIVVIENIYRLRGRGISAPRAAVQGTKQVAGAIISSTLTTVCVFLPLVFTTGMINELMMPLGLCIGFCLMASLIVALTVAPAAASTLLKNAKSKKHPWFDKFQEGYGKFLNWCLDHKAAPLSASILLLVLCVVIVLNMGIVLIPEMTGNQISVTITTPEDMTREESYAMADDVLDILLGVDGVDEVGVMDGSASAGMMGGMSMGGGDSYGTYMYYIVLPDGTSSSRVEEITSNIADATADLSCEVSVSAGSMDDMVSLLGSGLAINIYGSDLDTMKQISQEVVEVVKKVEGYTEITTSFGDGDQTIHLVIDKDKAMANGLTVAQVYMEISGRMSTSSTATNVTLNGMTMSVTVENTNNPLTVETLLDMTLTATTMDATGAPVSKTIKLSDIASIQETSSVGSIDRENQTRYVTVSADIVDGYNATLLARELSTLLDEYKNSGAVPYGYTIELSGESSTVNDMVAQMVLLIALGGLFVYLVMVAQFQSLMSPFIVLFTVPLAFTGGIWGLIICGEQLSMLSLMGFALLMGTVVNNGIVFVDYVNQLRIGGMDRRSALIATGKTRMRPILMTALTTILAMFQLILSDDMAGQMGRGMSIVVVGGMIYATVMTLIIVPVIYDILFKRNPRNVDVGSDDMDDIPDDAAEFIAEALALEAAKAAEAEITEVPIESPAE